MAQRRRLTTSRNGNRRHAQTTTTISVLNLHLGCTPSLATNVETNTTYPIIARERVCCQRWSVWGRRRSIGSGRPQTPSPQPTRPQKHWLDAGCAKCNGSSWENKRAGKAMGIPHEDIQVVCIHKESMESADTCAWKQRVPAIPIFRG